MTFTTGQWVMVELLDGETFVGTLGDFNDDYLVVGHLGFPLATIRGLRHV